MNVGSQREICSGYALQSFMGCGTWFLRLESLTLWWVILESALKVIIKALMACNSRKHHQHLCDLMYHYML